MDQEYEFGLNVLNKLLHRAFVESECDAFDCMSYNINLDYVLRLLDQYPSLKKVTLYSNSEHVCLFGDRNKDEIVKRIKDGDIILHHISENSNVVHAKIYRFWKDNNLMFGAMGSPNLTSHSNQNFECLVYLYDTDFNINTWEDFSKLCEQYGISEKTDTPYCITRIKELDREIDEKYLEGHWEHQKRILNWLVRRYNGIVNIPPGTGKTKIGITYIRYLNDIEGDISTLVLVPSTVLIGQWRNNLEKLGINCFEGGPSLDGLEEYFGDPEGKVVVTLYSRFFDWYSDYFSRIKVIKPNLLIISDECHNLFDHLNELYEFNSMLHKMNKKVYNLGLSATIEDFIASKTVKYLDLMEGEENKFEITLQGYYANWNDKNPKPTLKQIKYMPIKYCLTKDEMEEYDKLSRKVGMEQSMKSITEKESYGAAIKRASWVRSLPGAIEKLKDFITSHMEEIDKTSTLIFVQTNSMAEDLRNFITDHQGWHGSAYVYDSYRPETYKEYAMEQFRKNKGFCLISERMLREGYDLPKISRVIVHGSHRSPKDWLQKIGRAIRYDPKDPDSIAYITDIIFCNSEGTPLPIERERLNILTSISI